MGWKNFNDRLALVLLGLVGAMLFFLAVKEPGLRDKILILLGPWGTPVVEYYFRKRQGGWVRAPETNNGVQERKPGLALGQKAGARSPRLDHNSLIFH